MDIKIEPSTEESIFPDEVQCQRVLNEPFLDDVKNVQLLDDEDSVPIPTPSNFDDKPKAVWLEKDCKLLITLYKELSPRLGKEFQVKTKKKLWEHIADRMREHGCTFTSFQVEGKWKTFKRRFKSKTFRNKKTWRDRATCAFEEDLSHVMLERDAITSSYRLDSACSGKKKAKVRLKAGIFTETESLPSVTGEAECAASTSKESPDGPKQHTKMNTVAKELGMWREQKFAELKTKKIERQEHYEEKRRYREDKLQAYRERNGEIKRRNDLLEQYILNKKNENK